MQELLSLDELMTELSKRGWTMDAADSGGGCLTLYVDAVSHYQISVGPFVCGDDGRHADYDGLFYAEVNNEVEEEGDPYRGARNVEAVADRLETLLTV